MPDDLAKLSNVVKIEVVKKTDFSADDYVKKTKFSGDTNSLDDKIDKVEKKIPDVSSLETKRNVTTLNVFIKCFYCFHCIYCNCLSLCVCLF